ncbi:hypothetical protein ACQPZQ_37710 [Pseudonocardia sp. CA-142604]|uniref:hypothetical protein n=1 Tax=Pseudonocardia sp. CA-142604 TaxID=3240024 RepID=UPI003D8B1C4A
MRGPTLEVEVILAAAPVGITVPVAHAQRHVGDELLLDRVVEQFADVPDRGGRLRGSRAADLLAQLRPPLLPGHEPTPEA